MGAVVPSEEGSLTMANFLALAHCRVGLLIAHPRFKARHVDPKDPNSNPYKESLREQITLERLPQGWSGTEAK
jgi:hypothetical protein